jgi:hypothetical protein
MYHVFADLAEFAGAELLALAINDPLSLEALALLKDERLLLLVANLTEREQAIEIVTPALYDTRLRVLDETSVEHACFNGEAFRQSMWQSLESIHDALRLSLRPFAMARLDGSFHARV